MENGDWSWQCSTKPQKNGETVDIVKSSMNIKNNISYYLTVHRNDAGMLL
jgi:hypothetical protein